MGTVFILSGLGMYLFAKELFKNRPAFLCAILYLFAPYHLVDLHFRVALGEIFAYAILPFVFYFILRIKKNSHIRDTLLLFVSFCALILSHQAIAVISVPFIIATPLFLKGQRKNKITVYLALAGGLLLSTFYWLPVIFLLPFTHQITYAKTISFENPFLYFTSPWRLGFLYQGPVGQLSFPIGFVQLFLLITMLVLLIKGRLKKNYKKILNILLCILFFLLFMLLPISEIVWKTIPFLTNFQFAYRLMLPISFVLALIGGIAATYIKKTIFLYFLVFLSILLTILNWGNRAIIADINDTYLIQHIPYSTFEGEGLQPASPKWRDIENIWVHQPDKYPIQLLSVFA
jgi:hypothetical protein